MEGQRIVSHVPYWFGILGVRTRRWQIRAAAFNCASKRYGQVRFLPCQGDRASVREKLLQWSLNKYNEHWPEDFCFLARQEERCVSYVIRERRVTTPENKKIWSESGLAEFFVASSSAYRTGYAVVVASRIRLKPNSPISRCIYSETTIMCGSVPETDTGG